MKRMYRRAIVLAAAALTVFLNIGTAGREVKAAQTEQALQANPADTLEQAGYERWLKTLAETVDQSVFQEELSAWRSLYAETRSSFEETVRKGTALAAAAANTAARKAEKDALEAIRKLVTEAKEFFDAAKNGAEESVDPASVPTLVGESKAQESNNVDEAIERYRNAIAQLIERIGTFGDLDDAYDPETGYLTVMAYLENEIAERQAALDEAQAVEEAARAEAEAVIGEYRAKKAASDAAFAALKEAVSQAVEASFLVPEGEYFIFNGAGGNTVIGIKDSGSDNGVTAVLSSYSKANAQRFSVIHNNDGTVELRSVNSGKALDAAGRGILNGTDIRQYTPNGTSAQKWVVMDPDGDGLYTIKASYCPLVISTKDQSNSSGANVQLFRDNGSAAQEWRFAEPAGVYFIDVTDPAAWYYKTVYWAFENSITSGYGKDTFKPAVNVTRAQVVQFFYNMAGKPSIEELDEAGFTDVPADAWYYNAVTWASAIHLTSGYGARTFRPDVPCTRAMIAAFLQKYARYIGEDMSVKGTAHFADVKETDWFYDAVTWAAEQGLTSGYGEGIFQPAAPCNRAMLVTFLERADGKWNA